MAMNFLGALICVSKAISAFILEIATGSVENSVLMWYVLWGGFSKKRVIWGA